MDEENAKKYEITFWLRDEDPAPVKRVLEKRHVEISAERPISKFRLSYPIRKEANAFLGSVTVDLDPAEVAAVRADLGLETAVLRFMIDVAGRIAPGQAGSGQSAVPGAPRSRGGLFRRDRAAGKSPDVLTNEALEKKIEEISQ